MNSKNIFWGSTPPEHCLQRPLHSVKCTSWVAISKHGIIGPFWSEDDNERSVTVNTERYVQVLGKFWTALGPRRGLVRVLQWFQRDGATPTPQTNHWHGYSSVCLTDWSAAGLTCSGRRTHRTWTPKIFICGDTLRQWFANFFTWWHSFQGCKNFAAPLLQSHRHGGALVGLAPQTKCQDPQTEIWNIINHWSLCQTFNTVREIAAHELYCCLLPWCEALRTWHSRFPIATLEESLIPQGHETWFKCNNFATSYEANWALSDTVIAFWNSFFCLELACNNLWK